VKQEVIEIVRKALNCRMPMLILRGADNHARVGSDIDILVPSSKSVMACLLIAVQAKQSGWYLAGFKNIGYVASVTLMRPGLSRCDDAIKLDLIAGLEWYGVGSGTVTNKFLELFERHSTDQSYVEGLIAFATFLQKIMASGRLSERDWSRVRNGTVPDKSFLDIADFVGLRLLPEDMNENGIHSVHQWQLRSSSAGINGPIRFALWFPRVAFAHLRFKLGFGTGAGQLFGLSGLDGSGKSTQIERLFAAYGQAGGVQPRLVHLLPAWIPMPHQLLRRRKTEENYTRPYAEAPVRSKWGGLLRLVYYLGAFTVAKCWMRMATLRGQVLVLDRSFTDFAADLTRSRIPDFHLPAWLLRFCTPKGSVLFLDALPETVVQRKGELQLDKATELRQRYLKVLRQIEGQVVDAEGAPEEVFARLLKQIDNVYHQRLTSLLSK
jgi:thymidylate kinase